MTRLYNPAQLGPWPFSLFLILPWLASLAAMSKPPSKVSRPFPILSLFVIYTTTPADFPAILNEDGEEQHRDDASLEASKLLYFSATEDPLPKERKARLMGTVMGMADFAKMLSPGGAPSVRAVHSSKQRMVWLEPEPGYLIHATIDLPSASRHSRIASAATTSSTGSTGPVVSAGLEDTFLLESITSCYQQYRLHNGSFANKMDMDGRDGVRHSLEGYWSTWLSKWSVESGGSGSFPRVLKGFQQSPYLNSKSSPQLLPLLHQFSASNPSALPILLHGSSVLHLPPLPKSAPSATPSLSASLSESTLTSENGSKPTRVPPPPLTEADLLAIVEYLGSCIKPTTTISIKPQKGKKAKMTDPEEEKKLHSDKWSSYYTLGMGSYLSAPTIPSLPSVPIPSMPTMPAMPAMPSMSIPNMPALPSLSSFPSLGSMSPKGASPIANVSASSELTRKKEPAAWSLRNVSWGLGKKSSSSSLATAAISTPPDPPTKAAQDNPTEPPASTPSEELSEEPGSTDEGSTAVEIEAAVSVAQEPAPEVVPDLESLAEAIAAESLVEPVRSEPDESVADSVENPATSVAESRDEEDAEEESKEEKRVVHLYCGEDTRMEVRTFERGPITLALATLPLVDEDKESWLTSRATRLLEAVENVLDANMPALASYPHRHLVRNGLLMSAHGWPEKEQQWSGKADPEDTEACTALYECLRGLHSHPPTLETFVRVGSSQWIIGRREESSSSAPSATSVTDVFAVLPAKVGKDGSLIDAAEELRKLDRAYQKV